MDGAKTATDGVTIDVVVGVVGPPDDTTTGVTGTVLAPAGNGTKFVDDDVILSTPPLPEMNLYKTNNNLN